MNLPRKHLDASRASGKSFRFKHLFSAIVLVLTASLAACGGGSSGGSSSPTASSVTGIYTGGTTLAYFHLPGLLDIDPAYASGYSPTTFTLTLNSTGQFSIADNQGNTGGGTYTISGGSVTISSGTLYLNNGSCTQSSTNSCSYTIQSGTGGLTVSSGNISGTLNFYNSSNTLAFSTTLGLSVNTLSSVSLSQLVSQTFTMTFGTATAPNPSGTPSYNCTSPNALSGTTGVTVNGSTVYVPCITWNTYPDGNTNVTSPNPPCSTTTPCSFLPNNNAAFKMVTCPTLGSTCYPTSFPLFINTPNYPTLSVPSNALAFYVEATDCPSGSCTGGGANVGGYIIPASGTGGGVVGNFFVETNYCNNTTTYSGTISIVVSTSGSVQGSYFLGAGIPSKSTYTCSGSTYYNYPISFTGFTSHQY